MVNSQIHPFHFFLLVNEKDELNSIENRFYSNAYENSYSKKEGWAEHVLDGEDLQCYIEKIYFKNYIKNLFISEKIKSLELLDAYLLPYREKEIVEKLKLLKSTWVSIKDKADKNPIIKKYKLTSFYDELENEINLKTIFLNSKEKQSPYPKGEITFDKLTWTGTKKQLGNLFFGLAKEYNDKGKFWINTSPSNLENFIISCFVMQDGTELSSSTFNTYLKANKVIKSRKVDKDVDIDKLLSK